MSDGEGGRSGSVEIEVLAGHDLGVPSHLAGGAATDSRGEGEFVRCRNDATGAAGCVIYASTCPTATAAANATAAATATAAAACRVNVVMNMGGFDVLGGIVEE